MKLYNYWRSSASYRVRIALNLKGIPFEYVPVNLLKGEGEQQGAEHAARNPMRQVPVLEWNEAGRTRQLSQSLAIIEYLEEKFPTPRLLPEDAFARAQTRMVAEHIQSGIQPLQNLVVLKRVKEMMGGADGADARWAHEWIVRGLAALETTVAPLAGRYLVGDSITLADVCLVPQMFASRRFHVDFTKYPVLSRIDRELQEHPAFHAARPEAQPDAVAPPPSTTPEKR